MKITMNCPVCGISFDAYPSRIKNCKWTPVCSHKCLYKGRSLGIIKNPQPANRKRPVGPHPNKGKERPDRIHWIEWTCEVCGILVSRPRKKVGIKHKRRFCSVKCTAIGLSGNGNPSWRGGYDGYYGPDWERQRNEARRRDNYICQDCSKTEDEYGRELDVHHIQRFGDFTTTQQANALDNLISLCHSCHMYREWREGRRA